MPILSDITGASLRNNFNRLGNAVNALNDTHFADFAAIDPAKFSESLLSQKDVSVTRKASSVVTKVVRSDENADLHIPHSIGGVGTTDNFLRVKLADGALQFFTGATEQCYVDDTGWHVGSAPAAPAVGKIEVVFVPDESYWVIRIDGSDRAFIDALNIAGVFVAALASGDRTPSEGASVDFAGVNRIDFRNNGTVIGHITTGGFFAGA